MAELLDADLAEQARLAAAPDPASRIAGRPAPMPAADVEDEVGATYMPRSAGRTGTSLPAAGWYTDPKDALQRRWWDGGQWTNHVRPVVSSAARFQEPSAQARLADTRSSIQDLAADLGARRQGAAAAPAAHGRHAAPPVAPARAATRPAVTWAQIPTTNPAARASLVCGIVSVVFNPLLLLSVVAFVAGGAGLVRAGGGALAIGRRSAAWGIALGVVGAFVWAGLTAWLVMNPAFLGLLGIRMS